MATKKARFTKDGKKIINSRAKGADFERQIAKILTGRGLQARRGNQFNGMWDADVEVEEFPYHIECKKVESLNIFKAYAQSYEDCKGKVPIVVHAKNRTKIMVTLEVHDFLNLYQWAIARLDPLNTLDLEEYRKLRDEELL